MSTPSSPSSQRFVKCPDCGTKLNVRAEDAGRRGQCHQCGKVFRILSPSQPNSPPSPAGQSSPPTPPPPRPPAGVIDNAHLHPVVCEVCQTLMYATDAQVGKKVECPDCGHANLAKRRETKKPTARAMVADGDEYQLDETSVPPPTPKLTPIAEREAEFRAAARARAGIRDLVVESDAGPPSTAVKRPAARREGGASPAANGILPPVAPPSGVSPPAAPASSAIPRRMSATTDPRRPAVPVVQGVMRMIFTAEVMVRWMALSFLLTVILFLVALAANAMGHQALYILPLLAGGCIIAGGWLMSAAPLFIAITTQSADGNDELHDPPNFLSFDVAEAAFVIMAAMMSLFPAWLATKAAVGVQLEGQLAIGAGVWLLLFPFIVLSALEQGSALSIFSPHLAASLFRCFVPWMTFYMASTLLVAGAAAAGGWLLTRGSILPMLPVPWIIVVLILIYMRMIGRLGWWIADTMPAPSEAEVD